MSILMAHPSVILFAFREFFPRSLELKRSDAIEIIFEKAFYYRYQWVSEFVNVCECYECGYLGVWDAGNESSGYHVK